MLDLYYCIPSDQNPEGKELYNKNIFSGRRHVETVVLLYKK